MTHEPGSSASLGVLLVNLGTPDAPTSGAVRRFLRQFLWDPRVVDYPRVLWWLILNCVILAIRPSRSAHAYQQVWTERGSPLLFNTQDIALAMRTQMPCIEIGMTYGNPSIPSAFEKLRAAGTQEIIVLPLYPQYSSTTTAAVFDAVSAALDESGWDPRIIPVNDYHDAPDYITANAANIREHWEQYGKGERLLFSFHGVPKRLVDNGDPYYDQCRQTAKLIAAALPIEDGAWSLAFQSRVGREEWLQPYTDDVLQQLAQDKLGRVDVVCPGFAVDCLETLEEIAIRYAELFTASGGGTLNYIPALNAREDHVAILSRLAKDHAGGAIE